MNEAQGPVSKTAPSYEAASARVEEIIRRLDSGEASLGETLELVKEGKALIEHCAGELESVSGALARLERESGGEAGGGVTSAGAGGEGGGE